MRVNSCDVRLWPTSAVRLRIAGCRRVCLKTVEDPHPSGLSPVWLDPHTGQVLAVNRLNALDPEVRAVAVVYPLHTGELGDLPLEALVSLNGMALAMLYVAGVWLWWKRCDPGHAGRKP